MAPVHSTLKRARDSSPDSVISYATRRADSPPVKKARSSSPELDADAVHIPGISSVDDDVVSVAASTDAETEVEVDGGVEAVAKRVQQAAVSIPRRNLTAAEKRKKFDDNYAGVSDEDRLKDVASKWTSDVYKHFKAPIIQPARHDGKRVMYRFICRKYPSKSVLRADYEDSTGNMHRHIAACTPQKTAESEAITAYGAGSQYSYGRMRYLSAMWCARRHRPYLVVEDPEFRQMLKMLYGRVEIPTRMTVSRDVQFILGDSKKRVVVHFKNLPGRVHLCIDGWTSPNILAFLGITVHWHEEGKIRHIILDFVRLTNAHTGKYLAEKVVKCLKEFGLEEKVFAVTVDNTENNTTMLKEMHELVPEFRGECVRVRCFGHVLNLVVKAVLSLLAKGANDIDEEKDEAHEDDAEAAAEADEAREAADQALIDALDDDELQVAVTPEDLQQARNALHKILQLSRKVWNSPPIRSELTNLAAEAELDSEVLIRAVKTRWNTVTEVLERALEMRDVLGELCDKAQFNKRSGARLRRYLLVDEEWEILEQLWRLLHL
ncbi:hypothetical protein TRAPUB_1210 [Trametes pubescens]|uniref:AC transposase n=1 Tax=Trametes pubescens TaxID=154538 RepID=A0A1M2VJW3_TRAPU|nr:hypothetical protein TRAPUB_1210 [Trametes pubescens]